MGRPAVIDRERVAAATLDLIDESGLDAVSIERIAERLGVRGPSLYHHFSDKAAILTAVAELVLGDLDLDKETDDWQQWIVDASLLLFQRVVDHPNAAMILLEYLPDAPMTTGLGRGSQLMTEAGVDPAVQVLIMEGSEKLIWGWALQRAVTHSDRLDPAVIDRRWPQLAVAVRESRWNDLELVEASLRAFLAGVLSGSFTEPRPVG